MTSSNVETMDALSILLSLNKEILQIYLFDICFVCNYVLTSMQQSDQSGQFGQSEQFRNTEVWTVKPFNVTCKVDMYRKG